MFERDVIEDPPEDNAWDDPQYLARVLAEEGIEPKRFPRWLLEMVELYAEDRESEDDEC